MNLKLQVFKTDYVGDYCHYSQGRHIRFAVVDLDRSEKYPANYICLLPMDLRPCCKPQNKFSKLFGEDSLKLAKRLLTKALETEGESNVKTEIERRLSLLEPKPTVQVRCRVCGNSFESIRSGRFKHRICQDCKQKIYATQVTEQEKT